MRTTTKRLIASAIIVTSALLSIACSDGPQTGGAQTPTEAYRALYEAVQSKDPARIKSVLSDATLKFAETRAAQSGETVDFVIRNGFSAPAMNETMPDIRDEQIKDNIASIEVFNTKRGAWEMMPFIYENGAWKLAVGDAFANTWKQPGKTQTQREFENSNTMTPQMLPGAANVDFNKIKPTVIDPTKGNFNRGPNPTTNVNVKPVKIPTH